MTKPTDPDHIRLLERHVEEDTRILAAHFLKIGGIPLLLEKFSSDGFTGKTAVFLIESVSGMDDAALRAFLEKMGGIPIQGQVTITRNATHVFLNFGFEIK